jgi:hypothetical protein
MGAGWRPKGQVREVLKFCWDPSLYESSREHVESGEREGDDG